MFRRWWWILLVMLVVGALFWVMVATIDIAAIGTYVSPREYESTVVVRVNPSSMTLPGLEGDAGQADGKHPAPQFFETEFKMIKARKTLQIVIGRLDLTNRWGIGNEEAIARLENMIDTKNLRGTELISIRVRSASAEDARDIAMETAKAYRDRRAALEAAWAENELEKLEKALRKQEDLVEKKRKALYDIIKTKGGSYKSDRTSLPRIEIPERNDPVSSRPD